MQAIQKIVSKIQFGMYLGGMGRVGWEQTMFLFIKRLFTEQIMSVFKLKKKSLSILQHTLQFMVLLQLGEEIWIAYTFGSPIC